MKNKKDKRFVESGKRGADKRWPNRQSLIVELSKHVNKGDLNWMMGWPTMQLHRLVQVFKKRES